MHSIILYFSYRKLISLCHQYFLFVQFIAVPYICVIVSCRFWQLIEASKQNLTQQNCKYILGVLAGHLGIDNADRAGIFQNVTLQEYEQRVVKGDSGM